MVNLGFIVTPPLVESLAPSYLKMPATAILQCRPNSHPFPDRTLTLDEPVKIGRSVARARPAANNAIFDCKVLSRNHALLWYENGKFYLKDTKSSNGTFINNYRLSKGSEESAPQEVCSGDIVQYGVDVMENSKKVTHGCIIATLKLYLPDGQEAKASLSTAVGGGMCNISSQELYQLRTSLQEAQHREQLIESKLASFQQIISSIQEAASQSWTAMIDEDRLLQRLETLEDQLATYAKNCPEDAAREEIQRILEEKSRYEMNAKDSLQRILQEKVDATTRCGELERTLSVIKTELSHKKEVAEGAQKELEDLLAKQSEHTTELKKMTDKLKTMEENLNESNEKSETDKKELEMKLQEKTLEESNLLVKIESLKAENDFTKEQLSAIKAKYENIKNGRLSLSSGSGKDFKEFEFTDEEVKKTFQMFKAAVQALQDRLWQVQEELHQTQMSITQLKCEAEAADKADLKCLTTKAQLQDALYEKKTKEEVNTNLIDHLQSQLEVLESRLRDLAPESPKIYEDIYSENTLCRYKKGTKEQNQEDDENNKDEEFKEKDSSSEKDVEDDSDSLSDSTLTLINSNEVVDKNSLNGSERSRLSLNFENAVCLSEDINKLKDMLKLAESSRLSAKEEIKLIRDEFGKASTASVTASHEAANLHHQLAASEAILMEKTRYVNTLQEIGGQLENSIELIYFHLSELTQRLSLEKQETLNAKNETQDQKEKLKESEILAKESLKQMENLRAKLKDFEEGLTASPKSKGPEEEEDQGESTPLSSIESPHLITEGISESAEGEIDAGGVCTAEEPPHHDEVVPRLQEEMTELKKAYNELKESERKLKEQLSANNDVSHVKIEANASDASANEKNSVESLQHELKTLLEEHKRLKEKLTIADTEFQDLHLQNKMKIPTWLLLVMVIPIALGWQWISNFLLGYA